jgi:chromosome segregation ATPase
MDNQLWSALTSPLNSLVGIQEEDGNYNVNNNNTSKNSNNKNNQLEADLKRYRKRYQALQEEVDEVNEEATKTRKQLWEAQDSSKETSDKVRALENHLNEVLELREKDIDTINTLKVANSECLENESRAKESMEIFKKVYKRAQLKIKEDEEEIAILREQRDMVIRQKNSKGGDSSGYGGGGRATADESALEHIKMVSDNKEKRLKNMLFQAEREVELWKSKQKIAAKRVQNSREQILAMDDPTQAASHMEKQRVQIEQLEFQLSSFEEKGEREREEQEQRYEEDRDEKNRYRNDVIDYSVVDRGFCDEDLDDGLTKDLIGRIQNLGSVFPSILYNN